MLETAKTSDWHALPVEEVGRRVDSSLDGLSGAEAAARLERDGPNALPEEPPTSVWVTLLHQFKSPLIYILLAAAVVTLLLRELIDAAVIAVVLALNAIIGFTQERRAEQSVRALMRLMAPRAHVLRDGREMEIDGTGLVVGDIVLLESGARVPADLRLVTVNSFRIDESLLTGESLPVTKTADAIDTPDVALADRVNMAFMGSVVSTGRARGYVVATATRTELGSIAESIRGAIEIDTPLQQRMHRFATLIGVAVAISAVLALVIGVAVGQPLSHMFMVAVALSVAAIPEGLPVVFTITLAMAVRRMAKRHAIVRRLPAVETLGSTTVIGSDKTGTLTENRMTVRELWVGGETVEIEAAERGGPEDATHLAEVAGPLPLMLLAGVLTNEATVHGEGEELEIHGDPTEAALLIVASRLGLDPARARHDHSSIAELPFEPERQFSASVRSAPDGVAMFVKGAPERVLSMCSLQLGADGTAALDGDAVLAAAHAMGERGLRVLAMAYRQLPDLAEGSEVPPPEDLIFLGLAGMLDPPRAGVHEAIEGCQSAGIRVVMITGDHVGTATAIGTQLGIATSEVALTGAELERLNDDELRDRVKRTSIYARVAPEHKLRVVQAMRRDGEVVAVTGDGVNDAPALRAADIGVAMGRSGTDVAREAADMTLADDNFVSIYAAVREGRVAFDNLRKVTFFLVSTGAAAVIMILYAVAMGWPLPLVAAQILWLNLVTNGLQDVALAFEPGESDILDRPPRPRGEGVISRLLWERTALTGAVMAAGTLFLFRWELDHGASIERAQSVALTTMVLFQAFHVGNCRSEYTSIFRRSPFSNPFLFLATAAALLVHVCALYWAPLQRVLRLEALESAVWPRMVAVAATIILVIELHKLVRRAPRSHHVISTR